MLFISKKKLQEMLRDQASSIVKGIQNAESAERTFRNQRNAENLLNDLQRSPGAIGSHPTKFPTSLADSVSKIFEASNARIDDIVKANRKLEEENTALKATISALKHERDVLLAYIDEFGPKGKKTITPDGIVVVPEGAEDPLGGDPEDPTVYIGGNDPNAKVMFRSKKEPIGPVRTSGSVSISPTMLDEFMKWLKEQPSKAMNTTKKASEEESAGEPQKEPKVPVLQCAFCSKPLSTKMVSQGCQSDFTVFCGSECKDFYAQSREELRVFEMAWHQLYPKKDISLEELAELDLLAKLATEFPEEIWLIREIKDGLITIADSDHLKSSVYTTGNMYGIRAHLRSAKALRDCKAEVMRNIADEEAKAGLNGLGILTVADILAMSPEQREAIKQRIREAKEQWKDHPSPAMGAFRVQGSHGDIIEPLIPGRDSVSLLGRLHDIGKPKGRAIHIDLAREESKTVTNVSGVFDNRKTMCRERWEDGVKVSELACDDAMDTNESFPWGSFPDFPANMMGPQPPDSETVEACAEEEPRNEEPVSEEVAEPASEEVSAEEPQKEEEKTDE